MENCGPNKNPKTSMKGNMMMYTDQKEGKGRINRPEKTTRLKRRWGKLVSKANWYKTKKREETTEKGLKCMRRKSEQQIKQEVECTLYVPCKKGSELKKLMQKVEDSNI